MGGLKMRNNLIIVGTGLLAEVARVYFEKYTNYTIGGFACHAQFKQTEVMFGLPLYEIEGLSQSCPPNSFDVFVAIGYRKMNQLRQSAYEEVKALGYTCATFVHPNVHIWPSTRIGDNVLLLEDNTIQPFTTIGNDTILWSGNHIGHHSAVGNHCFISSHVVVAGNCVVGNNVFVGVNATLRDGVKVLDETLIGAGALIMKDTTFRGVYIPEGTEARRMLSNKLRF